MKKNLENVRKIRRLKMLSNKLVLEVNFKRSNKVYSKFIAVNNEEGD